jgi:RNA polymerase sigma factor (sigma-70 family)
MSSHDLYATSPSLLISVRDTADQQAWDEFYRRYSPMIGGWCHQWFPREADDMVQEVFVRLTKCLKSFDYEPGKGRFRGYLKTVTYRLMQDLKERADHRLPIDSDALAEEAPARTDLWERLGRMFDLELLEQARDNVRRQVTARTWSAYAAVVDEGRDAAEVARELGMKVGSIYQAKFQVNRLLNREIKTLEGCS